MRKLPPLRRLALGSGEPPEVELVGSDPGIAVIQDECVTGRNAQDSLALKDIAKVVAAAL